MIEEARWRVGRAVRPANVIEVLGRAASAIDGGPSRQLQRAMALVLQPERADQECTALRTVFSRKRDLNPGGSRTGSWRWSTSCADELREILA